MKVIDLSDKPCPMPVIEIKRALKVETKLEAIINDRISHENVKKFLNSRSVAYTIDMSTDGIWKFDIDNGNS